MARYKRKEDIPIDHGWAWVILLASFVGLFFMSLIYLNGIFQVVFLDIFGKDKFTTSWIFSINSSLLSFAGPLSSFMTRRLGSRLTVIIGSLIGTSGFILAAFSQTFPQIFVSYGIIVGVGFGISYLPCAVAVGFYFEKYRNIAFGLINMSVGLATIVLSPFITWTNEYYGWRGTMVLLGGMFLQLCVVGSVLRPVSIGPDIEDITKDEEMTKIIEEAGNITVADKRSSSEKPTSTGHLTPVIYASKASHIGSLGRVSRVSYADSISHMSNCSRGSSAFAAVMGSVIDVKGTMNGSSQSLAVRRSSFSERRHKNKATLITSLFDISLKKNMARSGERMTCSEYDISQRNDAGSVSPGRDCLQGSKPGQQCSHMIPSSRIRTVSEQSQCETIPDSHYSSQAEQINESENTHHDHADHDENGSLCERFTTLFALDVCKNPSFILYAGMNLFLCVAVALAYQHLPDFVQENGTSRERTATLLSLIGIANCASRFITGLAISNERVSPILVQFGSNGVVGIAFFFMPLFVKTFAGQAAFAVLFGFFANCYVALLGPLTILIAGLENLSNAYAILLTLCGMGFLCGPPMAGAIYDFTMRFEYSFVTAGVFCILAAIIMLPVSILVAKDKEKSLFANEENKINELDIHVED